MGPQMSQPANFTQGFREIPTAGMFSQGFFPKPLPYPFTQLPGGFGGAPGAFLTPLKPIPPGLATLPQGIPAPGGGGGGGGGSILPPGFVGGPRPQPAPGSLPPLGSPGNPFGGRGGR